jgi:hypothetical protein
LTCALAGKASIIANTGTIARPQKWANGKNLRIAFSGFHARIYEDSESLGHLDQGQ